jgi:hypothetical protein
VAQLCKMGGAEHGHISVVMYQCLAIVGAVGHFWCRHWEVFQLTLFNMFGVNAFGSVVGELGTFRYQGLTAWWCFASK